MESEFAEFAQPEDLERAVTETDLSPPRGNPFPIVGVGASAGGLEAFVQLLEALPGDTGMAFVLVQHLDPLHESQLPELLAPHTPMPVSSVADGMPIAPNHVYVIPPNCSIQLKDSHLQMVAREPGLHLPIDIFFRSLAVVQGSRAIGVVLSGNASDGSFGLRAIKAECGLTFAQDEVTARFGSMPRNAALTGAVDYVLPPAGIARELAAIAGHPFLVPSRADDPRSETLPDGDAEMRRVFSLLRSVTRVDFSHYKPTTIRRRVGRRMMVVRCDTLTDYTQYLEQNSSELHELYRDLLISVTNFFRDPDTFETLRLLLGEMITSREQKDEAIRVWVPGCATGEEVYSLAILLFEILQEKQIPLPIQIFGTDISELALDKARHGLYSSSIEDDVGPARLSRFFTKVDSGYQISKLIRESCVFARHDVTMDPPFSNLDLVSCRNVLIYLDQAAQSRVLAVFHYAMRPTGILLLGSAESTAAAEELFLTTDQQHKIYGRRATPSRLPLESSLGRAQYAGHAYAPSAAPSSALELQKRLDRVIQSKYSPDAVLINAEFQIFQFRGHTSLYLDPSPGQPTLNLLRMAKEGLVLSLRRAVQTARETNGPARESFIELDVAGDQLTVSLEVTPIPGLDPGERYFLVVFVRESPVGAFLIEPPTESRIPVDEEVGILQRELNDTRVHLRNLTEQYEAHAEELRAANEEARSANEELQSTNEELRTTKEELQSTNEELTTVNEELQGRNQELNSTNSDLKNLLSSVTIPIVMLDADLRVRRFNTAAAAVLDLTPVDIGRPVGHLRGRLETPRLEQQVRSVIETLSPHSEELQDAEGHWYLLNVRPYRTLDDHIAGAVITLQDIDPLKRGLAAAEAARDYAEGMIETVREPLVVLDSDLRVQRATQAFYEMFLVSRDETVGRLLHDLGNGQWNRPRLRELIGMAMFRSEPFHDFEVEHDFPHIGRRVVRLNGRRIPFPHADRRMLLLSIEDVTERREIAELRFQRLFETANYGIVVIDGESQTVQDVNAEFMKMTGHPREALAGRSLSDLAMKLGVDEKSLKSGIKDEVFRRTDLEISRMDGSSIRVDILGNSYKVGNLPVMQLNVGNVTDRYNAVRKLRAEEQRFRWFVESVGDFALFQTDPNNVIETWNSGAERLLGWTEKEAIGMPASILFTPEDVARGDAELEIETARIHGRAEDERWHVRKDGSRFFASGVTTRMNDDQQNLIGFAKVMRDVTLRRQNEEQLRQTISEKETLVREIHHRVKNNLQVIVSLLAMQTRYYSDPQVLAAFQEAESRLRAIAQIHERLYASEDLSQIEFAGYVTGLANELIQLHANNPEQIKLHLDVTELSMHIERAIPLGLIANELILNSIKHGFKGGTGNLTVRLARSAMEDRNGDTGPVGLAELFIADDGPGLPAGIDPAKASSMGLRLVSMLSRQLHGKLQIHEGAGAAVSVKFPLHWVSTMPGRDGE